MLRPSRGAGRRLARHADARTARVLASTHGLIGLAHAVSLCLGVIRPYRATSRVELSGALFSGDSSMTRILTPSLGGPGL